MSADVVADGTTLPWHEANQQYLTAALALLRATLERQITPARGGDEAAGPAQAAGTSRPALPLQGALEAAVAALPAPAALERVRTIFGLSPFETDLLLLCAAVELDAAFAPLCVAAHGDPARPYPTFGLALAVLPGAHWSALGPAAPLRRWRLVEVGAAPAGTPMTRRPLQIDERLLHYLAGVQHPDEQLVALLEPVPPPGHLVPSQQAIAEQVAGILSSGNQRWRSTSAAPPLVQLCGDERAGKHAVAARACATLGLALRVVDAGSLSLNPAELSAFARLWEREAALSAGVLLVDGDDLDRSDGARVNAVRRLVESVRAPLVLASRERWPLLHRTAIAFDVHRPSRGEQHAVWESSLGEGAAGLNGYVDRLVSQFNLGAQAIRDASLEARGGPAHQSQAELELALWDACRVRARPLLDDLAQRIEPAAGWDDLVLPEPQREILREIVVHVRQRVRVYDEWGFAGKGTRGLGISALFAGASGTGKTMAAEVLANELRLDLYRVDLSATVSKYIGETEKNLRRIFDAAEEGGAILLFDEADALFGKRSEVKDSHDRYANIEVSYLLQRMEAYRGLAILTTNLKQALDTAFLRRIRFVVQFPFPDAAQRAEIWRRIFPPQTPTRDLDVSTLARLNVAGGNIRNIALGAAFLAAESGDAVHMRHILSAAQSEYTKLEKPLTETEVAGWL